MFSISTSSISSLHFDHDVYRQYIVICTQTLEQILPYEERFSPTTSVRISKLLQKLLKVIRSYYR